MSKKAIKIPDSDVSARRRRTDVEEELGEQPLENLDDLQTSNKAGGHSTVEKLAASRPEFGAHPGAVPQEVNKKGRFRCNACGRFFDTETDLGHHEIECRAAKQATHEGAAELAHEDAVPHPPNDHGR